MTKPERIVSVDFLRGLTVAGMILVNNPGSWESIYSPLEHAHWNGCTPTDLVFPFFLFIVGISISYSLSVAKTFPAEHKAVVLKIVKRSLILFLLGLLLNIGLESTFETFRIPGVLQRISVVFLFSAILFLKTSVRTQIILSMILLIGYWFLMTVIPVPGIGAANLEVGTNLSAWLDRRILGQHVWSFSKTWDPEGILSTLPAIVSGLIGVLAGTWLKSDAEKSEKVLKIFIAGNVLIVAGLFWGLCFPINKSLWTSSYVLYTSGIALNGLAISYWLFDIVGWRKYTTPFLAFGSNAIAAYMMSELLAKVLYSVRVQYSGQSVSLKEALYQSLLSDWMNPTFLSFVLAVGWVLLIWIPIHQMHKKKIFIKV
jgi:predicted acyltransferase